MTIYMVNIDTAAPQLVKAEDGWDAINLFLKHLAATLGTVGTYKCTGRKPDGVYTNERLQEETAATVRDRAGNHFTAYAVAYTVIE